MADLPTHHIMAWTKADYDKYMLTHTRTPGDQKWEEAGRSAGKTRSIMPRDDSLRSTEKIKQSDRQRAYLARRKARTADGKFTKKEK